MNPNNKPVVRKRQVIQKSLDPVFNPQRQLLQKQISGVDQSLQGDIAGLEAKKTRAFEDITEGANRRGLVFSGIPLQEQAEFVATDFLPAQARLKQGAQDKKFALQQAMFELGERQRTQAESVFQQEQDRLQAYLARQEQLAAQRSAAQAQIEAARISAQAALEAARMGQQQAAGVITANESKSKQAQNISRDEERKIRQQFVNLAREGRTDILKAIKDSYLSKAATDPTFAARLAVLENVERNFANKAGAGIFRPGFSFPAAPNPNRPQSNTTFSLPSSQRAFQAIRGF